MTPLYFSQRGVGSTLIVSVPLVLLAVCTIGTILLGFTGNEAAFGVSHVAPFRVGHVFALGLACLLLLTVAAMWTYRESLLFDEQSRQMVLRTRGLLGSREESLPLEEIKSVTIIDCGGFGEHWEVHLVSRNGWSKWSATFYSHPEAERFASVLGSTAHKPVESSC